jgi:hypothetical protein
VKAVIELDHVNYGLNKKTHVLNTKKRTNFSNGDIEKFIKMLDGEDLTPERYEKNYSFFIFSLSVPLRENLKVKSFL